jgi:hypothetical protein
MSYQEIRSIVSILSTLLISVSYSMFVLQKTQAEGGSTLYDVGNWGSVILIFIVVSIVAKILIYIVTNIIYRITTREEEPSFADEMDKLIELRALRNSHYIFVIGFLLAMVAVAAEMPLAVMFITLIGAGVVSDLVGNVSQLYYYWTGLSR